MLILAFWAPTAHADQIDVQVQRLSAGRSYKVRLSAALALSKTSDVRAIEALVVALAGDDAATIRNVAALALGKNVDGQTPEASRGRAIAALEGAAEDDDAKVRANAARSLALLDALRPAAAGPAVFIDIEKATDRDGKTPTGALDEMRAAVRAVFASREPSYALDWPGGALPTRAQLDAGGTRGFYVGAMVSSLEVTRKGRRGEVKCSVTVRVNPWQGRDAKEKWESSKVASASGSGRAIGGSSDAAVDLSIEDCVVAVIEQVTAKQVVPFIRRLVGD
mgnify:CR=1 FL=1